MPWYHGDHLRDTRRLTHEHQWAYFLLINEYWAHGGLPEDDEQLAAIAGVSLPKWRKMRTVIQGFFHDGWKHKRIDKELAEATKKYRDNHERALKAANRRWHADQEAQQHDAGRPF
jgi:uncharacterized protein YdaU (DUF1376 family)